MVSYDERPPAGEFSCCDTRDLPTGIDGESDDRVTPRSAPAGTTPAREEVMSLDTLYKDLLGPQAAPRAVLRGDNTIGTNPQARTEDEFAADVDTLFGTTPSYLVIKKERPEHRMMLWMRLQGQKPDEIAAALRVSKQTVYIVQKQPWFQDAFCKLSKEMGKDAVQAYLRGEVMPALERTIDLAKTADSDAVKLAANKEILDRFLGKSVVKAEVKNSGQVDHVVFDANALLEEQRRNAEILRARGIGSN